MTIEEKMEHFRSISLESANSQSAKSLSSYKSSLDNELETHKESAKLLAEESKRALLNQVKATAKKDLASAQMSIKKDFTRCESGIKSKVFDMVREKLSAYRKTPEYIDCLKNQIQDILSEYKDFDITVYIDSEDFGILKQLKDSTGANIVLYENNFLGGTRTIIPEKNILVDHSFKTRLADEQENFVITL